MRVHGGAPRPALRDGDDALLLAELAPPEPDPDIARRRPRGRPQRAHRARARRLARSSKKPPQTRPPPPASPCTTATPVLPVRVPDYVDFYASLEHATNFGRIFRPGSPPVRENWRHMPVGYHGRASTIVVSGTDIRRPQRADGARRPAPTAQLDIECELGYVCGPSAQGPIPIDRAAEHIFGVVVVNDWSARDIQRLEYEPLGPFLGKSFATSMSAWITPLPALADARDGAAAPGPAARAVPHRRRRPGCSTSTSRSSSTAPSSPAPAPPACTGRRRRCSPTSPSTARA